jgi:hypothetical protein
LNTKQAERTELKALGKLHTAHKTNMVVFIILKGTSQEKSKFFHFWYVFLRKKFWFSHKKPFFTEGLFV